MAQKTNILICGDSFAADWTVKYNGYYGWPNLLAQKYEVTNIAQAGVGQYKILKQLQSVDIEKYTTIITSFTSPYRVHTQHHPVHFDDALHKDCDLLANDIEYYFNKRKDNESLVTAKNYFKYHFDFEYYNDIYELLINKCMDLIGDKKHIQISNLDYVSKKWSDLILKNKGLINHLSEKGNVLVYNKIVNML